MMKKHHWKDLIAWAIVFWTFVVTIGRAIRAPNDFSEAHWLLDYSYGFMKRGSLAH